MSNCDADTFIVKPMDKAEISRKRQESWQRFAAYWRHSLLPVSVQQSLVHAAIPVRGDSDGSRLRKIEKAVARAKLEYPQYFK